MKQKLISLILTAVTLCTAFSFTVPAKAVTEPAHSQDIALLEGLKLLECIENVPSENDEVTRAEFISIVMKILTYKTGVSSHAVSPFLDVDSDTDGYDYICAAYEQGIANGYEHRFFPASSITYRDAVKILLDVLGYYSLAMDNGGYFDGYLKIANNTKIMKGVSGTLGEPITFGNAAKLFANALNMEMIEAKPTYHGFEFEETDNTMMEIRMGVYTGKGILSENEFTSLNTINGSGISGCVTIGNYSGFLYKSFKPEEYLGYYVEYYYTAENNTILYLNNADKKNNVITVADSEIDKFSFDNRQFVYIPEGKRSTLRKSIPADAVVIVNGKNKPQYTEQDLMPKEGSVTLISNDGDSDIDVVIVTSYTEYFVGAVNKTDKVIVDYYDNTRKLDMSDEYTDRSAIIVDFDSNMLDFDAIKEHMVISAVVSEDGTYIRGVLSDKSLDASIEKVQKSDSGNPSISLSDGNSYRVSSAIADKMEQIFPVGVNGTVYFDSEDRVAGFIYQVNFTKYGFYIKAYNDDSGDMYVKLLDIYGEIKEYKAVKTFKLDDIKIGEKSEEMPKTSKVVLYTLDIQGNIKRIDTEEGGKTGNNYTITSIYGDDFLTNSYYPGFNSFRGKLWLDDTTVVFMCPKNPAGASETDYVVTDRKSLEKRDYEYKGYTTKKYSTKPEVVHVNVSGNTVQSLSTSSEMGVITDLYQTINDDDELIAGVSIVNEKGIFEYKTILNDEIQEKISNLSVGDYVAFNIGMNNILTNIDYIYNIDGEINSASDVSNLLGDGISYFSALWECQIGYVYNNENGYMGLSKTRPRTEGIPEDLRIFQRKDKTKVILVDTSRSVKRGRVSEADWGDISDYLNYNEADRVVISNGNCDLKLVVIYR